MTGWMRRALATSCHWTGVTRLAAGAGRSLQERWKRDRPLTILVYHRVAGPDPLSITPVLPDLFERQVAHLARHYNVVTLERVLDLWAAGEPHPANCVVLTFDDGYRDNYLAAFPILRKYGVPSTVFLTVGSIGTGNALWFDRVFHLLDRTERSFVEIDGLEGRLRLGDVCDKASAASALLSHFKRLGMNEREREIARLRERLGVRSEADGRRLMLDWPQIREMAAAGIRFGAHTRSHTILTRMTADQMRDELVAPKQDIEGQLGQPVRTFAYPNGEVGDYNPAAIELLRATGYEAAVTTVRRTNRFGDDRYALGRIGPWPHHLPSFALRLAWGNLRAASRTGASRTGHAPRVSIAEREGAQG